ncbi:hypothetical protein VTO42DRAFT_5572 [Malbranchea cinnamomea]
MVSPKYLFKSMRRDEPRILQSNESEHGSNIFSLQRTQTSGRIKERKITQVSLSPADRLQRACRNAWELKQHSVFFGPRSLHQHNLDSRLSSQELTRECSSPGIHPL